MRELIVNLIRISLFLIMLYLGLGLSFREIKALLSTPKLLLRYLVGIIVLVPIVAFIWLNMFRDLPETTRLGIALMAICPTAPLILKKTISVEGEVNIAGTLQFISALLSIFTVPLSILIFRDLLNIEWGITPSLVASNVLVAQILPLGLGLLLKEFRPDLADKLKAPLKKLSNVLFLALITLILVIAGPRLFEFFRNNFSSVIVMVIIIASTVAIGHLLGDSQEKNRTTLALVTSMRNTGLALLLASVDESRAPLLKEIVASYAFLTALVLIPYLSWRKKVARQHENH